MISLANAVVYDVECLPNVFTLNAEDLNSPASATWQISEFQDDRRELIAWFDYLHRNQIPMIGFNTLHYDYLMIHEIFKNPDISYQTLYQVSQSIINQPHNAFKRQIWESDRFCPQIDLFKIYHFDNKAKTTSLKALEVNMRSREVRESKLPFDQPASYADIMGELIPYNATDVKETKKFAQFSQKALEFRIGMIDTIRGDVMNFNDTKIGEKLLEQRLGDEICYYRDSNNRKQKRQTVRSRIALSDIIFPYVKFEHPEFQRVLAYMNQQVLTPDDLEDPDAPIKTKGVFSDLVARVGGVDFYFGTGGIHGSVAAQRFVATDEWLIRDIDVKGLYPSIAIVNRLAPAHLGERFVEEYGKLPEERTRWQTLKGKKCVEANSFKLAGNGVYGKSNSAHSVFLDAQFTMTITINGQLMLCMLAEWLIKHVPTFQIIQINTDGITYRIHHSMEWKAAEVCKAWEAYTLLVLEDANYRRMWIRDVNNYVAEDMGGKLKQKGAYWHPDPDNYADSISECQPPAWHKDFNPIIVPMAAVKHMVEGIPLETLIKQHTEPFDFMCRVKVDRSSVLMIGDVEQQRMTRYFVASDGQPMRKISPPAKGAQIGDFRRANKLTDQYFNEVLRSIPPGTWDERIHTKNKSRYELRESQIEAGWKVAECNNADMFDFNRVDYRWYVNEAQKLVI